MKRGGRQSPSINPNFRTMKRVLDMVVTVTAGKTHAGQERSSTALSVASRFSLLPVSLRFGS